MKVTSIKAYTPIRSTQNFAGNRRVLIKKSDIKALEVAIKKLRNDPEFLKYLEEAHARTEEEIAERRRSSIVPYDELRKPITI